MKKLEISEEDVAFAQREFAKLMTSYNDERLLQLCRDRTRDVIPDVLTGAACAAHEVKAALEKRIPWSLIRVGDGEGNVLSLIDQGRRCCLRSVDFFNLIGTSLRWVGFQPSLIGYGKKKATSDNATYLKFFRGGFHKYLRLNCLLQPTCANAHIYRCGLDIESEIWTSESWI